MAETVELIKNVVTFLNLLTPLGLCGGLAFIIYQLVAKKGNVRLISDNHLSGLPEMQVTLNSIKDSLQRIDVSLGDIRDGINYLRGRVNGRE